MESDELINPLLPNASREMGSVTQHVPYLHSNRNLLTGLLYFSIFNFAIGCCIWGAVWPDLEEVLQLNQEQLSYGLTTRYIASAVGAIAANWMFNLCTRRLVLIFSLIAFAGTQALTPFFPGFAYYLVLQVVLGIAASLIGTALNVWILELWRGTSKQASTQQALQFSFGIGCIIAPLISKPFISTDLNPDNGTNGTSSTTVAPKTTNSKIYIPLVISAVLCVISGVLLMAPRIRKKTVHIEHYDNDGVTGINSRTLSSSESTLDVAAESLSQSVVIDRWQISVLALIMIIVFFIEGMENTVGMYIVEFLINTKLKVDKPTALYMDAVFRAGNTVAKGSGILIGLYIKPGSALFVNFFILIIANIVLSVYLDSSVIGLWIGTVLTGIGTSTIFANILALTASIIEVTNFIGSLIILSSVLASAIYPLMIASSIKTNPVLLVYQNLTSVVIGIIILILLSVVQKYRPRS